MLPRAALFYPATRVARALLAGGCLALLAGAAQADMPKAKHEHKKNHAAASTVHGHHTAVGTHANLQTTKSHLAAVQSSIASAKQTIKLSEAERAQKEEDIKNAEIKIGTLDKLLRTTNADVAQMQDSLQQLTRDRAQHEADKQKELQQLQKDVQLSYRRGKDDYFKLMLNQQDPARVARLLKYYGIIQQARADRIQNLNQTLKDLGEINTAQTSELQKLAGLKASLQNQQNDLAQAQHSRQQALAVLNAQIETEDERLKRLQSDQNSLQTVMQQVEQQAQQAAAAQAQAQTQAQAQAQAQADKPAPPPTPTPVAPATPTLPPEKVVVTPATPTPPTPQTAPAEQQASTESFNSTPDYSSAANGRCKLPVAGTLHATFGSPRAGGLRWNGVLIAALSGTPVRAVKAGRVVYADYLRGYGFLIILDHGHGLMSLYGQNQSLLKAVGDSVAANDRIALVGSSGGNSSPALYFEVRVQGRPTNPGGWCQD